MVRVYIVIVKNLAKHTNIHTERYGKYK